jgi:hypothetical protein
MDFGFSRFLEMFEDRFGRHATTVLIALIATALAAYSIKVIVDTTVEFESSIRSSTWFTWTHAREFAAGLLGWLIGIVLFWIFIRAMWHYNYRPRLERMKAEFTAEMSESLERVKETSRAEVEAFQAELNQLAAAFEAKKEVRYPLDSPPPTPKQPDKPEGT